MTREPPLFVYGLGRSGGAVVARARQRGQAVVFYEARPTGGDIAGAEALGATRITDIAHLLATSPRPLTCVAAPGVPIDHPDLVALRQASIEVIGEVVWVLREAPTRAVGITGTAGKGTVTHWIEHGLRHAGVDAVAGGNIDPALAAVAEVGKTLVIEMSSFQLERAQGFSPAVAVVLNLGRDHLDRHRSVAAYHAAKFNLVRELGPTQTFVGNADDPLVADWLNATRGRPRRYSLAQASNAHWDRDRGELWLDGAPLVAVADLHMTGEHQLGNALAVALALEALEIPRATIASGLRQLRSLPGRQVLLGTLGGVRFIEDSIATRELAVAAALRATPAPVVWIAGGADKGADMGSLLPLVAERVSLMLGIGAAGPAYAAAASPFTRTEVIDHPDGVTALQLAVERGYAHLQASHGGEGSVLLAPLAASFDQFRDYRHRAESFRTAVGNLANRLAAHEGVAWTPSS
jgi:UDP-N-acetylmuramoylalanine--D-glutamate ligase